MTVQMHSLALIAACGALAAAFVLGFVQNIGLIRELLLAAALARPLRAA